jgi:hypothetical protein
LAGAGECASKRKRAQHSPRTNGLFGGRPCDEETSRSRSEPLVLRHSPESGLRSSKSSGTSIFASIPACQQVTEGCSLPAIHRALISTRKPVSYRQIPRDTRHLNCPGSNFSCYTAQMGNLGCESSCGGIGFRARRPCGVWRRRTPYWRNGAVSQ